jgi:hypothetical protein
VPYDCEIDLHLDSNHPFEIFKNYLASNPQTVSEIETAFAAVLSKVDPSDRGNRFVSGSAFEWILAAASGVAGIATIPGGHSENNYDLLSLRENLRGLWSIKSSTTKSLGNFRLTNTMNSSGAALKTPTLFLHPKLPGLVYLDPKMAPRVAAKVKVLKDATTISGKLINEYAENNPDLVAPLHTPVNLGNGKGDPNLDFVAGILTSGTYPKLGPIISDLKENSRTLHLLRTQFEKGILTQEQYQSMINEIGGFN